MLSIASDNFVDISRHSCSYRTWSISCRNDEVGDSRDDCVVSRREEPWTLGLHLRARGRMYMLSVQLIAGERERTGRPDCPDDLQCLSAISHLHLSFAQPLANVIGRACGQRHDRV